MTTNTQQKDSAQQSAGFLKSPFAKAEVLQVFLKRGYTKARENAFGLFLTKVFPTAVGPRDATYHFDPLTPGYIKAVYYSEDRNIIGDIFTVDADIDHEIQKREDRIAQSYAVRLYALGVRDHREGASKSAADVASLECKLVGPSGQENSGPVR